ncbi:MAG: type II toxin-antitoxin system RelE family toxin [Ignavibacteria bacterium]
MIYELKLSSMAQKTYAKAGKALAKKLARAFSILETNPFESNNIKSLGGKYKGLFRYRIGDYRIIYQVNKSLKRVEVLSIKDRKEAYE